MKKIMFITALLSMLSLCVFSQARHLKFQGYAVDRTGLPIAAEGVNVKFTIYDKDNPSDSFEEEHNLITDNKGLFTAKVSTGNAFNPNKDMWMKVETKRTIGEGTYNIISDARLTSVPYAISAENSCVVGQVILFAGSTDNIPAGWLLCNGTSLSSVNYPELFNVIGYTFGGSGATFVLPDLRKRVAMGAGTGYSLASTGGSKTQTLTVANLPEHAHSMNAYSITSTGAHTHTYTDFSHPDIIIDSGGNENTIDGQTSESRTTALSGNHSHNISGHTGATGGGGAFSIMQPYLTLNYIIRVY